MKIGILQTGHAPDRLAGAHGEYDGMFARLLSGHGFDFVTFNVVDDAFPDGPEDADGWLITGSRHGVYDDLPWIARLEALIRDIHAAGRPLVGICFGHQVIAQALGGRAEKFAGGWSVGRQHYEIEGETLALNAWHQDQVIDPPKGARIIGSNAFCRVAAMAIGDHVLTYQAHPEYGPDFIEGLIVHRGPGVVPQDQLDAARASLDGPLDSGRVADRIAAFFKAAEARAA